MSWGESPTPSESAHEGDGEPVVLRRAIDETDEYTSTVAGAVVEAVRTGRGRAPNVVTAVRSPELTVTSSKIGFPIVTHSQVADSRIVAAFIDDVEGDSRWSGIPLRPGTVIVYGPGAEHAAINRPGLSFTFVSAGLSGFHDHADQLEFDIGVPLDGTVHQFGAGPETLDLGSALKSLVDTAVAGGSVDGAADRVLTSLASLLASTDDGPRRRHRGIDSRAIVRSCIDFVDETHRVPSIGELCLAAHVSERRLRDAFSEEFDQPPSRYFRAWALDEAHRRLRFAEPGAGSVSSVAADLGLDHLGRFAGQYRQIYGEFPSETLQSPESSASSLERG